MQCVFCSRPAERACTRCRRFFCPTHGGDRLVSEGSGPGEHTVTRAVCDDCTPNQTWMQVGPAIGFIIGLAIFLTWVAYGGQMLRSLTGK